MDAPRLVTIGAFGFDEPAFFHALKAASVDVFCDLRRRRGVRGRAYVFVNARRLQARLEAAGIRYLHLLDLAPSDGTRALQRAADRVRGETKRARAALSESFVRAYEAECLAGLDPAGFIERIGPSARVVALFCVEREPGACHRSLAARRLAAALGLPVEDLRP